MTKIESKFKSIPNTGYLQIWLQRITVTFDRNKNYTERLCKKINDPEIELWNMKWLNDSLQDLIKNEMIINEIIMEKLTSVIAPREVELFEYN